MANNKKTSQKMSPMAVDKSQTPLWMRVVIILVAVSFVGGLVVVGFAGSGGTGGQTTGGTTTDQSSQRQATLDAALAAAEAQPDNPEVLTSLGHAYFDYAVSLYEGGLQRESVPYWQNAVIQYDKVLATRPGDDVLLGNKAFALYYAESVDALAALQAFVDAAADNAQLAGQVETARGYITQLSGSSETTTTP
jgi:hypothetical protein